MNSDHPSRAKIYDEQFAKAFPADWETQVLNRYLTVKGALLDVGCGTGRHVVPLAEKGFDVVGVDKDKEMLMASQTKLRLKKLNADLILAEAQKLPLKNNLFDYIITMGNVPGEVDFHKSDRENMVDEMKRTSKTSGTLIIELVHRYWNAKDLFSWAWRYMTTAWQRLGGKPIKYGDYTEVVGRVDTREIKLTFHAFTTGEAKKLLSSHGLLTNIEKRGRFFHDWFFAIGSRITES